MAVIFFDPDELIEYMPEDGDNRSDGNPGVVFLKFVPYSRIEYYRQMILRKNKGNSSTEKMGKINEMVQKKQFCDSIDRVEGYSTKDKKITTPEELYDSAPNSLISELVQAMENNQVLTEGQAKNFRRASGGTEPEAHLTAVPVPSEIEKTETVITAEDSPKAQEL